MEYKGRTFASALDRHLDLKGKHPTLSCPELHEATLLLVISSKTAI